ncbi:MAG: ABC transporter permease subunit [Verrucomicrobia bacterium]|nr:ABC transporter permease subunit [Verrucomicrobiota bacterium]
MNTVWAIAFVVILELIRKKDFYVLFVLTALITLVMGTVNFFNDDNIVRYLKEICLLLIWISSLVISISTAARQVPAEKENRTIFPLLAKPVTRAQLLLGKFLGCWLACGLALVLFYVFFGAVAASREHAWPVAHYFQALVLHWAALAVIIALTLAGSIVLAAPSSTVTITFVVVAGILYLGGHLDKVALRTGGVAGVALHVIYFVIPHLELFANVRDLIIHNWPLVPWLVWFGALLYAAVYAAIFLLIAWLLFRRKALNI